LIMGQTALFILFVIMIMVGAFSYFFPKHQGISHFPSQVMTDKSDDEMTGEPVIKKSRQLNITTNAGFVQIYNQVDDLTREQKGFEDMIADEKSALNNTNKEISDILKQSNGKNDLDVLKLKALGEQLQDEKTLLVAHGQQLIALKDQLDQKRKLLAEQKDAVNLNTDSALQTLQDHNVSNNNQATTLFDNVKDQNYDSIQHTKDLIEEERLKAQDSQNR
jgi:hypothetical protein